MDVLFPKIAQTLRGDADLGNLTSDVRQFRVPKEPKTLVKPVVVFRPSGGPDEPGLHGAAINVQVEVDVWGHGNRMYKECVKAAQRVAEIFLGNTDMGIETGTMGTRWREVLGWQQIDQPDDPATIVLRATYRSRYWSRGRIVARGG